MTAASVVGIRSFMPSGINLFPELIQDIVKSSEEGDYATAKVKQEKLSRAYWAFSKLGSYICCKPFLVQEHMVLIFTKLTFSIIMLEASP